MGHSIIEEVLSALTCRCCGWDTEHGTAMDEGWGKIMSSLIIR